MASAGTFRRYVTWDAGDSTSRPVDVGPLAPTNAECPGSLGVLRVGYVDSGFTGQVEAIVRLGDDGSYLGPIDLPFVIVAEAPMHLELKPTGSPRTAIRVQCSVTPACAISGEYAFRTLVQQQNDVVQLPQWVRRVIPLPSGAFTFRDAAGTPLSTSLTAPAVRPPLAAEILIDATGTFLLSYTDLP